MNFSAVWLLHQDAATRHSISLQEPQNQKIPIDWLCGNRKRTAKHGSCGISLFVCGCLVFCLSVLVVSCRYLLSVFCVFKARRNWTPQQPQHQSTRTHTPQPATQTTVTDFVDESTKEAVARRQHQRRPQQQQQPQQQVQQQRRHIHQQPLPTTASGRYLPLTTD